MKFFTNKSIWTKIVIVLIFVILFQFAVARPVQADYVDTGIEFAGKLMSPIISLVVSLGDACMGLMHSSIMGVDESLSSIDLDSNWWEVFKVALKIAFAIAIGVFIGGPLGVIAGLLSGAGLILGNIGDGILDGAAEMFRSRNSESRDVYRR